jgi:hypothetical protein
MSNKKDVRTIAHKPIPRFPRDASPEQIAWVASATPRSLAIYEQGASEQIMRMSVEPSLRMNGHGTVQIGDVVSVQPPGGDLRDEWFDVERVQYMAGWVLLAYTFVDHQIGEAFHVLAIMPEDLYHRRMQIV